MPSNENYPGGPLLQCVLQWEIEGAVDGFTPAPGVEVDNNVLVQRPRSPDHPFVIPVENNAGLFNPDGLGGVSARADRYLQWIRVRSATSLIPPTFRMAVADVTNGVITPLILQAIHAGTFTAPAFYLAEMTFVPQGSVLLVENLAAAPPGGRNIVQIGVRAAKTAKEDAELDQASCCLFDPVVQTGFQGGPALG